MTSITIPQHTSDPTVDVVLDTLEKNKQALVFVNSKRSAEKVAEDIAKVLLKRGIKQNVELSEDVLHVLSKPTVQCERLSKVVNLGVAFHHAGLTSKQKELVEDNFRSGAIKIICCTPTLAAGVDLPAFRSIIRDVKRFSTRGYVYIPVLEYLQMAGRAGRPKYDTEGQSIIITDTEKEAEAVTEKYVNGVPEEITSKLAVEPVLRTYILSLISSNFVTTREELVKFFSKTFWAFHFEDMFKLESIIDKMIMLLKEFEFITTSGKKSDFVSADEVENQTITATEVGKRVAELYIDPLTAHNFIESIKRNKKANNVFGIIQMISFTPEMRPLLNIKAKEEEAYTATLVEQEDNIITEKPEVFDFEYDEYLNSIKTATFFGEWMEEKEDDYLLETFDVRPGETRAKLDTADWLLYASYELAKLINAREVGKDINKVRFRLKYGVKEELLILLQLKDIGRIRARKLFNNGVKDLGDIKTADFMKLKQILGEKVAASVKEQVGEKQ
ncbi:MAG TPA: helicase-related protein, partial [Candidatus Nanoarchaeia archaeon]|nr:helicase-related protein [Candidatus Nanoarchaeia archaeon]